MSEKTPPEKRVRMHLAKKLKGIAFVRDKQTYDVGDEYEFPERLVPKMISRGWAKGPKPKDPPKPPPNQTPRSDAKASVKE